MKTLRLILGDQLNAGHPWFDSPRADCLHVMMEVRQETDYVRHHAQKIIAIFAAMRRFAADRQAEGHRFVYMRIGDPANLQSITDNLDALIAAHGIGRFEYQAPDEWRLDQALARYAAQLPIESAMVDTAHFLAPRNGAARHFGPDGQWLMESFYRRMRVRSSVLLDARGRPEGGQWNFDADNRKAWPGLPVEPEDRRPCHDHSALWDEIRAAGVASFGEPQADRFRWPVDRSEALAMLEHFASRLLPHFGDFQDAMSAKAHRLFHSLLSFALNVKLIGPAEVIARVEQAWRDGTAPLAAVEGYIRQILGWREYVRGFYWAHMPDHARSNRLEHHRPLPGWFWDANVGMRCLAQCIGRSLQAAHAHHIQRLMVIGNFALLAGLDPEELHRWYLGIYVDAFEWVELPNTIGMSQFADGGRLATKPYVSSAAYIDRMSDYCSGCRYDRKARHGERACPFNALYWDFFDRNRALFASNRRLGMVYRQLERMEQAERTAIAVTAEGWRARLGEL